MKGDEEHIGKESAIFLEEYNVYFIEIICEVKLVSE